MCCRFLDDERVSASRKGCTLRAVDLRHKREAQKDRSALPMPQAMLSVIRETNWVGLGWSTAADLDKRAAYLGNALSFDMALRVGSCTRKEPSREDHCIKSQDWSFVLLPEGTTDGATTEERIILKVGEALSMVDPTRVVAMDLMQVSVKGGENHHVKSIGRRSVHEAQLLEDMVAWAQKSGVAFGEDFFTRRALDRRGNWSKRSLLAKDINAAKRVATESLGLSGRFGQSHGSRKGGISQMASSGMDRNELLSRSNHSVKSSTSERVYQYRMSGPGALAVGEKNGATALSVADCRRIDAASSGLPPFNLRPGTEGLGGSGGNPL